MTAPTIIFVVTMLLLLSHIRDIVAGRCCSSRVIIMMITIGSRCIVVVVAVADRALRMVRTHDESWILGISSNNGRLIEDVAAVVGTG